jgi:hypothetical protein
MEVSAAQTPSGLTFPAVWLELERPPRFSTISNP